MQYNPVGNQLEGAAHPRSPKRNSEKTTYECWYWVKETESFESKRNPGARVTDFFKKMGSNIEICKSFNLLYLVVIT